ncbi:cholesterol oxidase substrate-binding domain-containing protein [Streptomyces sp. NPDC020667]|uniref:cholesterol oxidase substrate-binding domain-containing protein n=1 Tax=Streptomyces sp. NPDC020667 TaxID=3154895 RepID=UPI0033C74A97
MTDKEAPGRRRVLTAAAATAAGTAMGWTPAFRLDAHAAGMSAPPSFPPGIRLVRQGFRNWSGEVALDAVWTALPATPADVVTLADWARAQGWRLRPKGSGHSWSPLLARRGEATGRLVLVDSTEHLTAIALRHGGSPAVTAQAGATMDAVHSALEAAGHGLTCVPAIGDLTVAGALAIGGHGTGVPAPGAGHAFASTVSDLVESLTAVVWDAAAGRYALRTFHRGEPDTAAFLLHLGRAFVAEATLRVPANVRLRCVSSYDIPMEELFGPPGGPGRTLDRALAGSGRVEVLWLPYTERAWLKLWSEEPRRPLTSRETDAPYPYVFYDVIPRQLSDLAAEIMRGATALTPVLTTGLAEGIRLGLTATATWDLWGWSKNTVLYMRPTTLRYVFAGWAVLCARADVQRVLHGFWSRFQQVLDAHRARGEYPVNGPVDVRITGVDAPAPDGPWLSPARPRPDHPEWDTVVWLNSTTFPGTPGEHTFHRDLEQWMVTHFTGWCAIRPEWAKGWAYGPGGAWTDAALLGRTWPGAFRTGQPAGTRWEDAAAALDRHDPAGVFRSPFLERLFSS